MCFKTYLNPPINQKALRNKKKNLDMGRLFKKNIESVIMIIPRQNRVKEAGSIWSLKLKIV